MNQPRNPPRAGTQDQQAPTAAQPAAGQRSTDDGTDATRGQPDQMAQRQGDRSSAAADRQAGQEADRIETTQSNNHDDFGKGRAKDDGRETAREVAKRQGERDR